MSLVPKKVDAVTAKIYNLKTMYGLSIYELILGIFMVAIGLISFILIPMGLITKNI